MFEGTLEEEDGDRQEEKVEEKGEVESRRVRHGWNEDDCECAQNLSHEVRCVSSTETVNNARYVQTQCMLCATQSSKSTSSLVYLLCMVSCLLLCASFQFS